MTNHPDPEAMQRAAEALAAVITADDLKRAKFKAGLFGDGAGGMAFQYWECVTYPTLAVFWMRESRRPVDRAVGGEWLDFSRWPTGRAIIVIYDTREGHRARFDGARGHGGLKAPYCPPAGLCGAVKRLAWAEQPDEDRKGSRRFTSWPIPSRSAKVPSMSRACPVLLCPGAPTYIHHPSLGRMWVLVGARTALQR